MKNAEDDRSATESPWLTAREAAFRARTSPKRIYAWVGTKKLKAVRVGTRLLFKREWIDAALEKSVSM